MLFSTRQVSILLTLLSSVLRCQKQLTITMKMVFIRTENLLNKLLYLIVLSLFNKIHNSIRSPYFYNLYLLYHKENILKFLKYSLF